MSQSSSLPHPAVVERHPAVLLPELNRERRYRLWYTRFSGEWLLLDEHSELGAGQGVRVELGAPLEQVAAGVPTTVERAS